VVDGTTDPTPSAGPSDLLDPYADLLLGGPTARPWVALCAVASSDGVTAVGGSSRTIGGPADRLAMRRIRRGADAVLVGAATVRAEGYDGPLTSGDDIAWRRTRGLSDRAALVIVSHTLALGTFGAGVHDTRVIVLTDAVPSEAERPDVEGLRSLLEQGGSTLEVVLASRGAGLDWVAALRWLCDAGITRISCEGGPSVNAQLLDADLVDEVLLTVAPKVLGVGAGRLSGYAGEVTDTVRLELRSAITVGDELLVRYLVHRDG
jgi:riboflavin biosynthesis pyrimidine reductase